MGASANQLVLYNMPFNAVNLNPDDGTTTAKFSGFPHTDAPTKLGLPYSHSRPRRLKSPNPSSVH